MLLRNHIFFSIMVLAVMATSAPLLAEDGPVAVTAGNKEIAVEELALRLKPLTVEQLQVEVDAWIALFQETCQTHSDLMIESLSLEGAEKQQKITEAGAVAEARTALADRVNAAIVALRAKGGDVEAYQTYVKEASSLTLGGDVSGWMTVVQDWVMSPEGGIRWGFNILKALLALIVFKILASIVAGITRKAVTKLGKGSELLRDFFVNTVRRIVFIIGLIIALSFLEVDIGPFLAAIGVIGFVIGFALQETLANFASGVMILIYRPFDVGDAVSVAGVAGGVESMNLVSTTIKSWDNQRVVVPNGKIWGDVITNITGNDTRRVDMVFGIGYDDDIAKAEGILKEIIANTDLVLDNPEPVIKVHELADSSVNFVVRPWAKTSDYWAVYWDVTRAVKERFDAEGVSIPYPQQDVHMHQVS